MDDVDVRVLADYVADLGRARRPADDSRRRRSAASSLRYARSCARRSARRACPTRRSRPGARGGCPTRREPAEVDGLLAALEGDGPLALRNRALVELVYSAGLRTAEAVGLDLGDVDFEQEHVHVRNGKGAKDRIVPLGEEAALLGRPLPARRAPAARPRRRRRALPVDARPAPRHVDAPPPRPRTRIACATPSRRICSTAAPTSARSRSCSATARSRRRRSTATSTEAAAPRLRPRASALVTARHPGFARRREPRRRAFPATDDRAYADLRCALERGLACPATAPSEGVRDESYRAVRTRRSLPVRVDLARRRRGLTRGRERRARWSLADAR